MRILCATDLLPKSDAAVDRAAMIARGLDADLSLVHVVASSRSEDALERRVQRALTSMTRFRVPRWQHRAVPNVLLRAGNPASEVVRVLREARAQLVVLGPHRRRRVRDALGGTIAEKVLGARCCPVLIVRREPLTAYRNILLALDLSPASGEVVETAESLIRTTGAASAVIHAFEPPYSGVFGHVQPDMESVGAANCAERYEAKNALQRVLTRRSQEPERYDLILSSAFPAEAVLRAIARKQPDLLVMGTRGHGRVLRGLLGSVTDRVLRSVACDVLIVPRGSLERSAPVIKQGARHFATVSLSPSASGSG